MSMSFQTSNSGAFRSLHCLIYKVLAAASVAERFLFYHTFSSLSSTFFNFFRSFFNTLLAPLSASESFVILSHQLSFVKCFFQLFQSFSALNSLPASSSRKLDYLTTSASVCQVLFSDSFEPFFLGPPEPRSPLGQLAYYTKSSPLCQYLSGKKLEISRNLSFPVCPCRSESTFHLVFRRNRDLHCGFFLYTFIII